MRLKKRKRKTVFEIVQEHLGSPDLFPEIFLELKQQNISQRKCQLGIQKLDYYQLCQKPEWGIYILQDNWLFTADFRQPACCQINPFKDALVFNIASRMVQVFQYVPKPFKQSFIKLKNQTFLYPHFRFYHVFKVIDGLLIPAKNFVDIENAENFLAISRKNFKGETRPFSIALIYQKS